MKKFKLIMAQLLAISTIFAMPVVAETNENEPDESKTRYYVGTDSLVNTGKDNGYSGEYPIESKDHHYGWTLGKMSVSGYTRVYEDEDGTPIFLKKVGDEISFEYTLMQDIDNLKDEDKMSIAYDDDGYDQYFGTEHSEFGRGTLIIRKKDYENKFQEPQIFTNFFEAVISEKGDTTATLLEEGDYEVALDYKVKYDPRKLLGYSILPEYSDYRESAKFKIRNGNCMVFLKDIKTGSDLGNGSTCKDGFVIDLAKSRYLKVNVQREMLNNTATGLVEDVQFNGPAKDNEKYTKEGIYTITAENPTTDQTTTKKIYVGDDKVMIAYITTGQSIEQIKELVADGAIINDDGTVVFPVEEEVKVEETPMPTETPEIEESEEVEETTNEKKSVPSWLPFILGAGIGVGAYYITLNSKKNKASLSDEEPEETKEEVKEENEVKETNEDKQGEKEE